MISSVTSPCTTISSSPCGFLETEAPVANFVAKNLAAFLRSTPSLKSQILARGHTKGRRTEGVQTMDRGYVLSFVTLDPPYRHLSRPFC